MLDAVPAGHVPEPAGSRRLAIARRATQALRSGLANQTALLSVALVLGAGVAGIFATRPGVAETVAVGSHVVLRGTHLDGDRLAPEHPLHAVLPAQVIEVEPQGYLETEEARLRVRRHCAWGLPGRNPYRGSVEQALQTSQLSATVVKQIAADVRAGRPTDRVTIGNDTIRAQRSGREFNPQRVAMTYGMTLCVDTRVNFKPGHTESADLYEAMDDDGRIYAVMVPEVCGNVSVLGQRYVQAAMPPLDTAGDATEDPRPWMRLPPELRMRELPAALRFADEDPDADGGDGASGSRSVPAPGSLALSALALVAAWAATRAGRR